jgi:hypothetical protein
VQSLFEGQPNPVSFGFAILIKKRPRD